MAASCFKVEFKAGTVTGASVDRADGWLVWAESAEDAKTIVQNYNQINGGNRGPLATSNLNATAITSGAANLIGWTVRVVILGTAIDISVVGAGTALDTIDEIAAALATALNETDPISNAAYNASTQVLTVAGGADGLGDKKLLVEIYPPNGEAPMTGMVGAIVDGGQASDALSVTFKADAYQIPKVHFAYKRVM